MKVLWILSIAAAALSTSSLIPAADAFAFPSPLKGLLAKREAAVDRVKGKGSSPICFH